MILLTGASGFIGKHLLEALINKFGANQIIALTSTPITNCAFLLHENYNFNKDFFADNKVGQKIEIIIHAGAFTPKVGKEANDWEKCNSNILNTHTLLGAYLPNLKKIIYLSTLDIYGQTNIIKEDSLVQPISLYGDSKLYTEKMIAAWAFSNNRICQILRVGHVYGPGEEAYQKIIPVTFKKILNRQVIEIWGTGNEIRSFIYIKDIVSSILNAIELNLSIGPVNLVGNQKVSINDLVNKMIVISGIKCEIKLIPVSAPGRDLIFDNAKMKEFLLAEEISLEQGLLQEFNYMKTIA